jgi:hypothetical protein
MGMNPDRPISCKLQSSPHFLQISLTAAMTLGLKDGRFYRNVRRGGMETACNRPLGDGPPRVIRSFPFSLEEERYHFGKTTIEILRLGIF